MENFTFHNPTKIIFGQKTELQAGSETAEYSKKILLHYGGGSIKESGLYDRVVESLNEAEVQFTELGGVVPNPRLDLVRQGIEICRNENIDFILAVGGGSVIDSAKGIAAGVPYKGDVWDFYKTDKSPETALPIGTILTLPAAGSESSPNSVITDEKTERKLPMRHAPVYPVFSILNPELTLTLPDYQTACGLADMLSHILERYFTDVEPSGYVSSLCEASMRAVIKYGRLLIEEPDNYNYRAEIMWAGTLAHNGLLNTGSNWGDWSTHGIEHELSAKYDIAHGAGLAILFPAWMTYVHSNNIDRFVQFGRQVFGIEAEEKDEVALKAIEELTRFFSDIGMPTSLEEADIDDSCLKEMAELAVPNGVMGRFAKLTSDDVFEILKLAL